MSPRTVTVLYLVFAAAELAWEAALILLNMRHVASHAAAVPPFFRKLWASRHPEPPEEKYARGVRYSLARLRLSLLSLSVSSVCMAALAASGGLGWIERLVSSAVHSEIPAGMLFVLLVGLLLQFLGMPFGLYAHFVIEARFGFNTMSLRLWLLDRLKGLLLSAILLAPLLAALFVLVERGGSLWWVTAAALVVVVQIVLTLLYPAVIAPLFNKFAPLPDGPLRRRVLEMAKRLGFGVKGILVMDASRRSRHSNAYFTGLGRAKRIVFYDTLLSRVGEEEILSVLAHEIGHEKLGHVREGLVVSAILTVAGAWFLSLLLGFAPLYQAFGIAVSSPAAAVVILAFCAGPFTFYLQPLASLWSRRHEYAADRYAHAATGSSSPLVSALFRLSADNLSNLTPHPLYSFYHYSHPTLEERVSALEALDST